MQKFALSLLSGAVVFALLMGGCQASPSNASTETPVVAATRTLPPTGTLTPAATLTPLPTSTPTNTPYPPSEEILSAQNAAQIRQLTRLGKGRVTALEYSPDGNYLAVGTTIGVVIYDMRTWSETQVETEDRVSALAFSPSGNTLAVGVSNGMIQLLEAPDWSVTRTFVFSTVEPFTVEKSYWKGDYTGMDFQKNVGEIVHKLAFSPDGELLVAGGWDGTTKFWRIADGTLLKTTNSYGMVNDIAFHPDGKLVVIANGFNVAEWRVTGEKDTEPLVPGLTYSTYESSQTWFDRIAFSPDGKSLTGWSSNEVVHWQTSDGQIINNRQIRVWDPAKDLSADGKTLAVVIRDVDRPDSLEIWDLDSGATHPLHTKHAEWIRNLALAPDGATLAASFDDGTIQIIDILNSEPLRVLDGFPPSVDEIWLHPDKSELLSLNETWGPSLLQDWDLAAGTNTETIDLTPYGVTSDSEIVFSPDGSRMAVGNKNLQIWDFGNKKVITTLTGDQTNEYSNIKEIAFSEDGNTIAYSFDFGGVRLATMSGNVIQLLDDMNAWAGLCLLEDGQTLTNGSQFWELERGRLVKALSGPYGRFFFTPSCDYFVSMAEEGYFRVRRNTGKTLGERVGDFDLRKEGIYLIAPAALSPDHSLVAVQEAIGKIRIFSLETMKTLAVLEGHTEEITSLSFSPDGKYLVSGSRDGTIRLWGIHP